jgi:hypothetical protein
VKDAASSPALGHPVDTPWARSCGTTVKFQVRVASLNPRQHNGLTRLSAVGPAAHFEQAYVHTVAQLVRCNGSLHAAHGTRMPPRHVPVTSVVGLNYQPKETCAGEVIRANFGS